MQPSTRVRRALRNRDAAQLTLERARTELHDAIVADLDNGVRQAELVRLTGYSRERIRQLARARCKQCHALLVGPSSPDGYCVVCRYEATGVVL